MNGTKFIAKFIFKNNENYIIKKIKNFQFYNFTATMKIFN